MSTLDNIDHVPSHTVRMDLSCHAPSIRERERRLTIRFGSTVGQFCLLAGLRAQVSPGREGEFKEVSQERYVTLSSRLSGPNILRLWPCGHAGEDWTDEIGHSPISACPPSYSTSSHSISWARSTDFMRWRTTGCWEMDKVMKGKI